MKVLKAVQRAIINVLKRLGLVQGVEPRKCSLFYDAETLKGINLGFEASKEVSKIPLDQYALRDPCLSEALKDVDALIFVAYEYKTFDRYLEETYRESLLSIYDGTKLTWDPRKIMMYVDMIIDIGTSRPRYSAFESKVKKATGKTLKKLRHDVEVAVMPYKDFGR